MTCRRASNLNYAHAPDSSEPSPVPCNTRPTIRQLIAPRRRPVLRQRTLHGRRNNAEQAHHPRVRHLRTPKVMLRSHPSYVAIGPQSEAPAMTSWGRSPVDSQPSTTSHRLDGDLIGGPSPRNSRPGRQLRAGAFPILERTRGRRHGPPAQTGRFRRAIPAKPLTSQSGWMDDEPARGSEPSCRATRPASARRFVSPTERLGGIPSRADPS